MRRMSEGTSLISHTTPTVFYHTNSSASNARSLRTAVVILSFVIPANEPGSMPGPAPSVAMDLLVGRATDCVVSVPQHRQLHPFPIPVSIRRRWKLMARVNRIAAVEVAVLQIAMAGKLAYTRPRHTCVI